MNGTSEPGVFNSFNSTLVQLKAKLDDLAIGYEICFNSTLVQLKVVQSTLGGTGVACFNSTLVQLKAKFIYSIRTRSRVSILP